MEMEQGANETTVEGTHSVLTDMEIDAIGEVLNISMGSAATAISTMLDKQVLITTPKVAIKVFDAVNYSELEPAMLVKITYVEGISGSNVMVFRQRDMQLIINQLMGVETPLVDGYEFDELSMSAACEVMNQMMGASATALSEFLGKTINISTPTATIMDEVNTFKSQVGVDGDVDVVQIVFNLSIADIMQTEFVSIMTCDLAKMIVSQFMGDQAESAPPPVQVQQQPEQPSTPGQTITAPPPVAHYAQAGGQMDAPPPQAPATNQMPPMAPPQMYQQPPMQGYDPAMAAQQQAQGMYGMPPPGMYPPMQGGYPPYGGQQAMMPQWYPNTAQPVSESVNVQNVQFPSFTQGHPGGEPINPGNMDLIMNVPLSISIEIGKTKKKIRDIMDFSQGTVIELEKQAGAPVDIVVNGQLIARGDVVVIDDNFGVRITEIVGTKELLGAIENKK